MGLVFRRRRFIQERTFDTDSVNPASKSNIRIRHSCGLGQPRNLADVQGSTCRPPRPFRHARYGATKKQSAKV